MVMVTMKQEESTLKLQFGNEKQQNVNILTKPNPKKSFFKQSKPTKKFTKNMSLLWQTITHYSKL
jgi:outer membrane protein assembly factor BamE (lipoprotein component of BamABCDE complex)